MLILMTDGCDISSEIALRWTSLDLSDDKWPDPYVFTVYMTHRWSVYILYGHTNGVLILVTSYLHIHFSYVHECILTALYCPVFVLLMHVFLWLSLLLLLYIVRNDENKDD